MNTQIIHNALLNIYLSFNMNIIILIQNKKFHEKDISLQMRFLHFQKHWRTIISNFGVSGMGQKRMGLK